MVGWQPSGRSVASVQKLYRGRIDKALWWLSWNTTISRNYNLSNTTAHTQQWVEQNFVRSWAHEDMVIQGLCWLTRLPWCLAILLNVILPFLHSFLNRSWRRSGQPNQVELHFLITHCLLPCFPPWGWRTSFPSNMANSDHLTEEALRLSPVL